jgi:hypothetical protein
VTFLSSTLEVQVPVILVARFHHFQEALQLLPLGKSLNCCIIWLILQLLHPLDSACSTLLLWPSSGTKLAVVRERGACRHLQA